MHNLQINDANEANALEWALWHYISRLMESNFPPARIQKAETLLQRVQSIRDIFLAESEPHE